MRATLDTALLLPYIYVAGHRFKVPTLSIRHWVELSVGVVILAAVLAIRLSMTEHPQVTRQQAIQAALKYGNGQPHPRVEAKYMRYSDLAAAQGDSRVNRT
jgi:hypothetical protein